MSHSTAVRAVFRTAPTRGLWSASSGSPLDRLIPLCLRVRWAKRSARLGAYLRQRAIRCRWHTLSERANPRRHRGHLSSGFQLTGYILSTDPNSRYLVRSRVARNRRPQPGLSAGPASADRRGERDLLRGPFVSNGLERSVTPADWRCRD